MTQPLTLTLILFSRSARAVMLGSLLLLSASLDAAEARIAVAANFTAAAKALQQDFEQRYGHRLRISYGSTGKLYTQIYQGAPFELFMAADAERPARAEREGLAVAGSRITYAVGGLALWSAEGAAEEELIAQLKGGHYRRLAMANPKIAPYGAAAVQVMAGMALNAEAGKQVYGENIAQTYQFVATGNAELGFVALAQMINTPQAHYWAIPKRYYQPIRQQAVLLKRGTSSAAAQAFLAYLGEGDARAIIQAYGYGSE
ncbi:MAG: molybdate ABC transporter substrate-binding protein [Motiliproteus sp.]